jgi:TatD DNase family protein
MIIDSHCHIDFNDFNADRDQVLQRAQDAAIEHIIVPSITARSWSRLRQTCLNRPQLHPAYGLHPYFIDEHRVEHLAALNQWLNNEASIAVGECGLDFYLKHLDRKKQIAFFEAQLDIAQNFRLPVIIHARKATEPVIQTIKKHPDLRGMIHSYSGSLEQAKQLIDLGFYISFGGAITYDKATRIRSIAQQIPLRALLVETDAPDQPDRSHHGERNEPAYILNVLHTLSALKELPVDAIAKASSDNAISLFGLNPEPSPQNIL